MIYLYVIKNTTNNVLYLISKICTYTTKFCLTYNDFSEKSRGRELLFLSVLINYFSLQMSVKAALIYEF